LVKQRKQSVEYRNVRLSIETYKKLDKYLLELIKKKGDRHISLDEAIKSLIEASILLSQRREGNPQKY
jgi:hypothetical protein